MAQRRPWTVWMLLVILVCKMNDGGAADNTATTTTTASTPPPTTTASVPSDPSALVTSQTINSILLDITAGIGGVPDYYIVETNLSSSNQVNVTNDNGNISTQILGLAAGTCYTANIKAWKGNLNSNIISVQGNVCTLPSDPSALVTSQTINSILLDITAGIGGVPDYYIVETNLSSSNQVNVTNDNGNISTQIIGLAAGTCYTANIKAWKGNMSSNTIPVQENVCTLPSSPVSVTATNQTNNSITLRITKGTGNVDCYIISTGSINQTNRTCTVNTSGESSTDTTYNYTGLLPGQGHTFYVRAMYKDLTSDEVTSSQMYTVPSVPNNVQVIGQTTNSIQLSITKGTGDVDYYDITCQSDTDGDSCNGSRNTTSVDADRVTTYNYTGLSPGHVYTFNIVAKYNTLTSSLLVSGVTSTFPSSPLNVTATTQTNTSITLVITKSNGSVDCYIISTSSIDSANKTCTVNTTSEDTTTYNYTGLGPGQGHTFYVRALYEDLTSDEFNSSQMMYTVPSTPSAVEATSQTSTSVTLNITKGTGIVGCYIIRTKQSGNTSCSVPTTETSDGVTTYTTYRYSGLDPGQSYMFYVKAKYMNLISDVATSNETNTVPSNLTNLAVAERTTHSLSVSWSNGDGNKDVVYNVTCVSPNKGVADITLSNTTQLTSFDIPGLTPGSLCFVNITPLAGDQTGTSLTDKFYNLETAPSQVTNTQIVSVTARSMYVRWGKPDNPNGVIRHYVVKVTENTGQPQSTVPFCCNCSNINPELFGCNQTSSQNITGCPDNPDDTFTFSKTTFNHNITDLHPYRNYSIQVIPYTQCAGEATPTITNQTDQDKQEAPPSNLSVVDYQFKEETSLWEITLTWLAPSDLNGIIVNYTVEFNYLNDNICYNNIPGEQVYDTHTSEITWGTRMTLNHTFRSDWKYRFKVTAATTVGAGNFSVEYPFHTPTSTPGSIATSSVVPSDVLDNSVMLRWDVPCRPNGPISSYIITWQSRLSPDTQPSCPDNGTFTTTSNDTQTELTYLLSSRNYTFYVAAESLSNGTGDTTQGTTNTTSVANPYQPDITNVTALNATSVHVSWSPVTCPLYTGPTTFTVTGTNAVPDTVTLPTHTATCAGYESTSCIVTELEEYWEYIFTVTATTNTGHNTSVSLKTRTKESRPGEVQQFKIISEQDVTLPRSIHVSWDQPSLLDRNGAIQSYTVQYTNNDQATGTKTVKEPTVTFENIAPGNYNITIFATNNAANGSETSNTTTLLPGAPLKPSEKGGNLLAKKVTTSGDPEKTVAVQLPLQSFLCNDKNGAIKSRGVVVAEATEANDEPYAGTKKLYDENILPKYKTWSAVKDMDPIPPYIATPDGWNPCGTVSGSGRRKRRAVGTDSQPVFVVGKDGEDCESGTRCNGALPDGRTFKVKIYACTDQGCTETMYSLSLTTETNIVLPAVLGTIAALIVVAAVGIAVFVLRRKQALCFGKDEEGGRKRSIEVELVIKTHPVNLSEFPEYTDGLFKDSRLKFSEQYNDIKDFSPAFPINVAESQPCRSKNRYTNIMPFDKTRVRLLPLDDVDGSDFINANYIPGYNSQREYIATQGPLPSTKDDFWRMVWEQNVEVIVMLTKCMETGRIKCDQYWPDLNEPVYYGDLIVAVQSESVLADYVIRIIEVKLVNEVRQIRQLCFLSWPDMGCPDQPIKLLDFVKTVRQNMGPNCKDKPLLVHCSAGVGRTGTFIAVDHLLKYIREHDEVDIFKLVLDMRNHRCNMVQTEDQYVYIHECLREFITDDDEEEEEEEEEHLYANSNYGENVYENTAFSAL